eukprot:scaffold2388_cov271-Prasinococcus_capsulatus_cf.AAC.5
MRCFYAEKTLWSGCTSDYARRPAATAAARELKAAAADRAPGHVRGTSPAVVGGTPQRSRACHPREGNSACPTTQPASPLPLVCCPLHLAVSHPASARTGTAGPGIGGLSTAGWGPRPERAPWRLPPGRGAGPGAGLALPFDLRYGGDRAPPPARDRATHRRPTDRTWWAWVQVACAAAGAARADV